MDSNDEIAIVRCGTTKGDIKLKLVREWSPNGYDRAVDLFERHFYDHSHFFRAVPKFLVQFGISYSKDKELVSSAKKSIRDDPKHDPPIKFHPGIISYAGSGPNSRTHQMFISYGSAQSLGTQLWETPIGEVIEGMEAAEQFYSYGDMPPWGKGPVQGKIYNGPQYIENNFPLIDKFLECSVERSGGAVEVGEGGAARFDDGDDKVANEAKDDFETNGEGDDGESGSDEEAEGSDNYLLSEEKRKLIKQTVRLGGPNALANGNKLKGIGGFPHSQNMIFPAALGLMFVALFVSLRGRRKDTAKMN